MSAAPLEVTVLGATGATGLELTRQALDRGYAVVAVARRPERIALPDSARLIRRAADVRDPPAIAAALRGSAIVLSGLGVARREQADVLLAGARAVVAARPGRIVWLGAFGTGPSAQTAGPVTRALLRLVLGRELPDKVAADTLVLAAGGTLVHAGPLTNHTLSPSRRTVPLDRVPQRLLPAFVGRATVAAAMLDAAEQATTGVLVPLEQ